MKKISALMFGLLLLASPALALAYNGIPVEPTVLQLLTRVAALDAQVAAMQTGKSLSCAMLFSTSSVPVGQGVVLAWGSVGAVEQTKDTENIRAASGASTFLFSEPGNWTYSFIFYAADGGSVACQAKIVVTP
jgi:hypothetical protein